jgi:hypothetical protein
VDPKYVKAVKRLSDLIRTLEAVSLDSPDIVTWLRSIVFDLDLPRTLIEYLEDPHATSPLVQQVCRVLIMLLRLSEAKDAPPDFAERVQAVLLPDPGALSSAVFAVLQAPLGEGKHDLDAVVSLLTLSGVALRFSGTSFDKKWLAERALDLLEQGEHLEVLCNYLVAFAVNTSEETALELLSRHAKSPIFGEVLSALLNEPLGVGSSEFFTSDSAGATSRAQVLAGLLFENNSFLYKNDLRIVLEVLVRELPESARQESEDSALSEAYVDCVGAVLEACNTCGVDAMDAIRVFSEVARDELVPPELSERITLALETADRHPEEEG